MVTSPDTPTLTYKGPVPLISYVLWFLALLLALAFFLQEPITLGWMFDLGLASPITNGDYVAGRFITGGLALAAVVSSILLRYTVEVRNGRVVMSRGIRVLWKAELSQVGTVETALTRNRPVLALSVLGGQHVVEGISTARQRRFLRLLIDQFLPTVRLVDTLGWIEAERKLDEKWYRQPGFQTAKLVSTVACLVVVLPAIFYFGFVVRPSGVADRATFVVTAVTAPPDMGGWVMNRATYGSADPASMSRLAIASLSGDLNLNAVGEIVFDPSIWSFAPGDTCEVEIAKLALGGSLVTDRDGYYVKNVLDRRAQRLH